MWGQRMVPYSIRVYKYLMVKVFFYKKAYLSHEKNVHSLYCFPVQIQDVFHLETNTSNWLGKSLIFSQQAKCLQCLQCYCMIKRSGGSMMRWTYLGTGWLSQRLCKFKIILFRNNIKYDFYHAYPVYSEISN